MKFILVFVASLSVYSATAQEDYKIQINDTTISVALDKNYQIFQGGKKINFKITANDTLNYTDNLFSFLYPKDFKVSKSKIDDGIEQLMLVTADGSGVIIQKYKNINPTALNDIMLSEVTKESINYGFQMTRKDYNRTLKSGQSIKVSKAILNYKDEENIYEIATMGKKDEGVLIMTMRMDGTKSAEGEKIIDMIWKTFRFQ